MRLHCDIITFMTLAQLISRHASAKRQTPSSYNSNNNCSNSSYNCNSSFDWQLQLHLRATNAQLVPSLGCLLPVLGVPRTINVSLLIKCAIYNIFLCGSRATRNQKKPTANAYAKNLCYSPTGLRCTVRNQTKGFGLCAAIKKVLRCRTKFALNLLNNPCKS